MSIADDIAKQRNRPVREKTRTIMRTLFMPEIKLSFGTTGMTHRAFLSVIAAMFIQSGLLAYNHPAKSMDTIGSYGLRDLMGEAWYNLRHRGTGDIQQYGLFFSVFLLFALAIMMVVTFAAQMFTSVAQAAGAGTPGGLFTSPDPDNDIGLQLIKYLVGMASEGGGGAAEQALGTALSMYSYGVLVIATFIIAWAILSIVVDTAATGKFFGGRHNPVWWPIRLIFALGILIPLGHGFNAGQYMVIQIAKWGSNLASNVWVAYVDDLLSDGMAEFIANKYPPGEVAQDMKSIAKIALCMHGTNKTLSDQGKTSSYKKWIRPHAPVLRKGKEYVYTVGEASGLFRNKAKCGRIIVSKNLAGGTKESSNNDEDWSFTALANSIISSSNLHDEYFTIYNDTYARLLSNADPIGSGFVDAFYSSGANFDTSSVSASLGPMVDTYMNYESRMNDATEAAITANEGYIEDVMNEVKSAGWPMASLWYYVISSANAQLDAAVKSAPSVDVGYFNDPSTKDLTRYERKHNQRARENEGQRVYIQFDQWWNSQVSNILDSATAQETNPTRLGFYGALETTSVERGSNDAGTQSKLFDSKAVWTVMAKFNGSLKNLSISGDGPHPIVVMAEIGREMIWAATGIILAATVVPFGLAMVAAAVPFVGNVGAAMAEGVQFFGLLMFVLVSPLMIGGVVLSIILPMTPFIRFVFAISGWLIAIIEAVVMVPIMALGHLRTDGEGIMGPMLQSAYIMMLQLLLRPVLILLGLIFSMFLVSVTVGFVNDMFMAMLDTIPIGGGWNPLNHIIRFVGFGVMYGVLMFGLINSSFKIVDLFPEAVVKYLGSGASGGMQDREESGFNQAILASAVFASGNPIDKGSAKAGLKTKTDAIKGPKGKGED